MTAVDTVVQASSRVPTKRKLPKLNDIAMSRHLGKRRAASIAPKTATASTVNHSFTTSPSKHNNSSTNPQQVL